jgi:hypothetical protein
MKWFPVYPPHNMGYTAFARSSLMAFSSSLGIMAKFSPASTYTRLSFPNPAILTPFSMLEWVCADAYTLSVLKNPDLLISNPVIFSRADNNAQSVAVDAVS